MQVVSQDVLVSGSASKLPEYQQFNGNSHWTSSSETTLSAADDSDLNPPNTAIGSMFDLSLLKSVTFVLVGLSGVVAFTGIVSPEHFKGFFKEMHNLLLLRVHFRQTLTAASGAESHTSVVTKINIIFYPCTH